jgi:HlyD family secretion protein
MKKFATALHETHTDDDQGRGVRVLALLLSVFLFMTGPHCSKSSSEEIKAPGIVDGDIITLKAATAGTLQRLAVKEGENVTRDQLVAQVDADKIENQLNELEISGKEIDINGETIASKLKFLDSDIRYLQKQVQRFRRLKEKNAVPGEKLESMELKLMEAESSRFQLQKSLESLAVQREKIENKREYLQLVLADHTINAPVDGVVVEKFISAGETVFPGTALVDILDRSSLYVEVFIEEREMAGLKLNQAAAVRVDGRPGSDLPGVISYFGKKAEFSPKYIISEKERQSLLYRVKVKIQDSTGILKIGMPVTVILGKGVK